MSLKVALVNDTSLYETHFGCELVCQCFREQFSRLGMDLVASLPRNFDEKYSDKILSKVDLVVVNGEGSIHHGKNMHLLRLSERYPSVLVNCVYQENPTCDGLAKFLYISARESLSAAEIRAQGCYCEVVPDMIYASSFINSYIKNNPIFDIGFTDNIVMKKSVFRRKMLYANTMPREFLAEITKYRRICTGRFHGAVIASILGIPFSTWDSNTHKIKGLMGDIGILQYHHDNFYMAKKNVPQNFDSKIFDYVSLAKEKITKMFDGLVKVV